MRKLLPFVTITSPVVLACAFITHLAGGTTIPAPTHPEPQPPPNYSGLYDLTYTALSGNVEVCVSVGAEHACKPVVIDIPLYNGQATVDSLDFILDTLTTELAQMLPRLPEEAYPSYVALIDYLFPLLVEELNAVLEQLPDDMTLVEQTGSPLMSASMQLLEYGVTLPGEITVQTGDFNIVPEFMTGRIDADNDFRGAALYEVPLTLSQSTDVETHGILSTSFTLSLTGVVDADMSMKWNALPASSRPAFRPHQRHHSRAR